MEHTKNCDYYIDSINALIPKIVSEIKKSSPWGRQLISMDDKKIAAWSFHFGITHNNSGYMHYILSDGVILEVRRDGDSVHCKPVVLSEKKNSQIDSDAIDYLSGLEWCLNRFYENIIRHRKIDG